MDIKVNPFAAHMGLIKIAAGLIAAAVAIYFIVTIFGGPWLQAWKNEAQKQRTRADVAVAEGTVSEAEAQLGREVIPIYIDMGNRNSAAQATHQDNSNAILALPSASTPVSSDRWRVRLNGLCQYSLNHDDPRCVELRGLPAAGGAGAVPVAPDSVPDDN